MEELQQHYNVFLDPSCLSGEKTLHPWLLCQQFTHTPYKREDRQFHTHNPLRGSCPSPNAGNAEIQMAVRGMIPKLGMHTGRYMGKKSLTLSVWGWGSVKGQGSPLS